MQAMTRWLTYWFSNQFRFIATRLAVVVMVSIVVPIIFPSVAQAQAAWEPPLCDPSADPTTCNIAAPINVSSANQVKAGSLTVGGFSISGSSPVTNVNLTVPNSLIVDDMVSNTLTASKFSRGSGGTDAVDLSKWHTSTAGANIEVVGALPAGAITDEWVNVIGDTMTGTLLINNSSGTSLGISNTSTSGTSALDVVVTGSIPRAVNITTQATSGTGIWIDTSAASSSTGIYITAKKYGVYAYSDDTLYQTIYGLNNNGGTGVYGHTKSGTGNSVATQGYMEGTGTGVVGFSSQGNGVNGITAGTTTKIWGVTGCAGGGSINCGFLGGNDVAGRFDDRVVGDQFLALNEPSVDDSAYRATGKWGSIQIQGVDWQNLSFMESDGEELWLNLAHPANPMMYRLNSAMATQNISASPGSIGFVGAAIGAKGFVTVRNTDGEICEWQKNASSFACPGTPDADLQGTESLFFDGTYYWAGRTNGRGITQFDNSYSVANIIPTTGAAGGPQAAIIDFVQDETNVYALEDSDVTSTPSNSRLHVIDRKSNKVTATYVFTGMEVHKIIYDGKYIWGTALNSSGKSGLLRIVPASGQADFLDFQTKYGTTQFDKPNDLVFDGTYIWVILGGSKTMARISPYQEDIASPKIIGDEFVTFTYEPLLITFDGEAIWVVVDDTASAGITSVQRFFSGHGSGYQTTTVFPKEGISLWDYDTGQGICLRVESGALTVNTGALCN